MGDERSRPDPADDPPHDTSGGAAGGPAGELADRSSGILHSDHPGDPGGDLHSDLDTDLDTDLVSDLHSDLVAYLVVVVPDVAALAGTAPSLVAMVESGTVRLLDLVVVSRRREGEVEVRELGATAELASVAAVAGELGGLLTEHDIELVSLALPPGTTGLVLVTEDRWAASLSAAARRAGGRILAGERIPAARVEAALYGSGGDAPG